MAPLLLVLVLSMAAILPTVSGQTAPACSVYTGSNPAPPCGPGERLAGDLDCCMPQSCKTQYTSLCAGGSLNRANADFEGENITAENCCVTKRGVCDGWAGGCPNPARPLVRTNPTVRVDLHERECAGEVCTEEECCVAATCEDFGREFCSMDGDLQRGCYPQSGLSSGACPPGRGLATDDAYTRGLACADPAGCTLEADSAVCCVPNRPRCGQWGSWEWTTRDHPCQGVGGTFDPTLESKICGDGTTSCTPEECNCARNHCNSGEVKRYCAAVGLVVREASTHTCPGYKCAPAMYDPCCEAGAPAPDATFIPVPPAPPVVYDETSGDAQTSEGSGATTLLGDTTGALDATGTVDLTGATDTSEGTVAGSSESARVSTSGAAESGATRVSAWGVVVGSFLEAALILLFFCA